MQLVGSQSSKATSELHALALCMQADQIVELVKRALQEAQASAPDGVQLDVAHDASQHVTRLQVLQMPESACSLHIQSGQPHLHLHE